MEWAFGVFIAIMIGLYIWSTIPARRALSKNVQRVVDGVFDSYLRNDHDTIASDNQKDGRK